MKQTGLRPFRFSEKGSLSRNQGFPKLPTTVLISLSRNLFALAKFMFTKRGPSDLFSLSRKYFALAKWLIFTQTRPVPFCGNYAKAKSFRFSEKTSNQNPFILFSFRFRERASLSRNEPLTVLKFEPPQNSVSFSFARCASSPLFSSSISYLSLFSLNFFNFLHQFLMAR